jgi:site-specific recombinase XerD
MDVLFKSQAAVTRLRKSPLGEWLDGFVSRLRHFGYPLWSQRSCVVLAADLGRWMARRRLKVTDLGEDVVAAYVLDRMTQRDRRRVAAMHFLAHLRAASVLPLATVVEDLSPVAAVCAEYAGHLRDVRGAAKGTITGYVAVIREFLKLRFGAEPVNLDELGPAELDWFMTARATELSQKRLAYLAGALRSFLRYAFARGAMSKDLSTAVLAPRKRHPPSVPSYLSVEQVERLLAAVDPSAVAGSRDRAILVLIARLGLRAGEVAALELDDIRWRSGEIVVRGKGSYVDRLPLPQDVGEALAHYLVQHRPQSAERRLFLRLCAPIRPIGGREAVSCVVRAWLQRADLHPRRTGAHVLRHSLGTRMIRSGATLAEIGEVLRHHSPGATETYAKVDFEALRTLAPPWPVPGGAP